MKLQNTPLPGEGQTHSDASQSDILIQHKQEPRIDSRVISERAGIQHESLSATIKSHQSRLRELGSLPRQSLRGLTDLKSGKSGDAVREVARRMNAFASLLTSSPALPGEHHA